MAEFDEDQRVPEDDQQDQEDVELEESGEAGEDGDAGEIDFVTNPDGSVRYEDGYFIAADGTEYNPDGSVAKEAEAPEDAPEPEKRPSPRIVSKTPPKQVAYTPPVSTGPVFDENNMWQPGELERFQELEVTAPVQAFQMYSTKIKQLENWANSQFENNLDHLERSVPEASKYARQISRMMQNLTYAQRQDPSAPRNLLAQVLANELVSNPDKLMQTVRGPQQEKAPAKAPVRKPAPPVNRRIPPANGVRRSPSPSAPQRGGINKNILSKAQTVIPGITPEQLKMLAEA